MTLFIACLLIYHYGMDWWWYVFAVIIWMPHIAIWDKFAKRKFAKDWREVAPAARGASRGSGESIGAGRASAESTVSAGLKSDSARRADAGRAGN